MPVEGDALEAARIPVFASVPSKLDPRQAASKQFIYGHLRKLLIEPRTVGGSDYAHFNPLHEVRTLARHCAGGIILGYSQVSAVVARDKHGKPIRPYSAPTPWNNLETGILFGLGLPLLVLKESNISGGIFDEGASDIFIHAMPMPGVDWDPDQPTEGVEETIASSRFAQAVLRWQALVRAHYYDDRPRDR